MIVQDNPRQATTHYTPAGLPAEVSALDDAVSGGLGVGSAGKVGLLELTLAPSAGITRVVHQFQRAPLYVYRPIYVDVRRPDMAFVYLQQSGDGLVQGDRYRIDIDCAAGATTHITTQAPTKVFKARHNCVTQLVNLRVGPRAVLEYLPDPVVPCRGSRLFQRTRVNVDPTATVILTETLLPGRVAHGEMHLYDLYWSEIEVCRPDGELLFTDLLRLRPTRDGVGSLGLLGLHDVVGSLHVVTAAAEPGVLVNAMRASVADPGDVLVGVSELPNGCGATARVLGPTSATVQNALRALWNAARLVVLGAPAPDLRKG